jgi:CHAT domain-containing protein/tetratricopeptide (TPR) repeat protein
MSLQETFDKFWEEIRQSRPFAGQPRNEASSAGVSIARNAMQIATEARDDDRILDAWRMLAYSLTADEQYTEAIPCYARALDQCEKKGNGALAAKTRIGYVSALTQAGQYDEALKVAAAAELWLTENGDRVGYARLCTNIANLYFRLDEHVRTYEYYVKALEVFESTGDRAAAAQVYANLGCTLSQIDRLEECDAMFERAEQASIELGLGELLTNVRYNRAYFFFLRGRYSDALAAFARLREYFRESGSEWYLALCDLDESQIYLQLNISRDAASMSWKAVEQCQRIGMKYEEAKARAFFGAALMQMRRFGEALESFAISQKGFEAEKNQYWIAVLDLHRAEVYLTLERYWEARALADQARIRFETLKIPSRLMLSLVLLGRIALAMDNIKEAEARANEVSLIIEASSAPLVLFPFHVLSGQIAEGNQEFEKAEQAYQLAAQDLELHHQQLQQDDLRITFLHGRNQVYEALVRLSLESPEKSVSKAYSWCERAKSRSLVELLAHHVPTMQPREETSLLRQIHRLREELNLQYLRSKPETRPNWAGKDMGTVTAREQELARTLREVALKDPEYVSLQQVQVAELESVQQFIPADTTIIEYFCTKEEVLAFVISRDDARVFRRMAPPSRVQTLQQRLGFQLEKFLLGEEFVSAHSGKIHEATLHHLRSLYEALLAPLIPALRTSRLIVIPHGTLHSLPFHAFTDGDQYVIDKYEVTYAPSASVLHYCLDKPDVASAIPLILGVADEFAPKVEEEVRALGTLFPGSEVLLGSQATRENFKKAARSSRFVHIATHATFRQDNPMFSSFKLADGYVTAMDLFSMECGTNLVALSGCKSGMSEVSGSDDLLGLMRGFLYSGARSLLMSLWNVNDESTVDLMTEFYRTWQGGERKGEALRHAMRAVREIYPNPFHWAPFFIVGKI